MSPSHRGRGRPCRIWVVAVTGLALAACAVNEGGGRHPPATSPTSFTTVLRSNDASAAPTVSTPSIAPPATIPPALPDIPMEFEEKADSVLAVLSGWGYDTNTGEADSASVMARHLTPLAGNDLPSLSLSLEWGQDEPYGDRRTVRTIEANQVQLHLLDLEIDTVGMWFDCDGMLIVFSGELPMESLQELAITLHGDACD